MSEITRLAALVTPQLIVADAGIALPDCPAPVLRPDLPAWACLPPAPLHLGDPDREAYVIFTSGTSAAPMAVSHAHRVILALPWYGRAWSTKRAASPSKTRRTDRFIGPSVASYQVSIGRAAGVVVCLSLLAGMPSRYR